MMSLTLYDFEKLAIQPEKIINNTNKSESGSVFFTTYKNRFLWSMIGSFLSLSEKLQLICLNKFTFNNLKKLFDTSAFLEYIFKLYLIPQCNNISRGYSFLFANNFKVLKDLYYKVEKENKAIESDNKKLFYTFIGRYIYNYHIKNTGKNNQNTETTSIELKGHFSHNGLFIILCHILQYHMNIQSLDISENNISPYFFDKFELAFSRPKPLKLLNLAGNHIGKLKAMNHLINVFDNIQSLNFLDLSRINFDPNAVDIFCDNIYKLINLETLLLDENNLEDKNAGKILLELYPLSNIKTISLANNKISDNFAPYLKKFKDRPYPMQRFCLSGNTFSSNFFTHLGNLKMFNVAMLEFEFCQLNDDALSVLLKNISNQRKISQLHLNSNHFSDSKIFENFILKAKSSETNLRVIRLYLNTVLVDNKDQYEEIKLNFLNSLYNLTAKMKTSKNPIALLY